MAALGASAHLSCAGPARRRCCRCRHRSACVTARTGCRAGALGLPAAAPAGLPGGRGRRGGRRGGGGSRGEQGGGGGAAGAGARPRGSGPQLTVRVRVAKLNPNLPPHAPPHAHRAARSRVRSRPCQRRGRSAPRRALSACARGCAQQGRPPRLPRKPGGLCPGGGARRQVREALAAKHVIRVCSAAEGDRVAAAARRLLESAALIQQSVDLSGARACLPGAPRAASPRGLSHAHFFFGLARPQQSAWARCVCRTCDSCACRHSCCRCMAKSLCPAAARPPHPKQQMRAACGKQPCMADQMTQWRGARREHRYRRLLRAVGVRLHLHPVRLPGARPGRTLRGACTPACVRMLHHGDAPCACSNFCTFAQVRGSQLACKQGCRARQLRALPCV